MPGAASTTPCNDQRQATTTMQSQPCQSSWGCSTARPITAGALLKGSITRVWLHTDYVGAASLWMPGLERCKPSLSCSHNPDEAAGVIPMSVLPTNVLIIPMPSVKFVHLHSVSTSCTANPPLAGSVRPLTRPNKPLPPSFSPWTSPHPFYALLSPG